MGKKEKKKKANQSVGVTFLISLERKKSPRAGNQQQQKAVPGLFVRPDSPPQASYAPSSISSHPTRTQKQSFLSQTRETHREETRRPFPGPAAAADKTENNDDAIRQNGDLTGTNDYGSILHIVSQRLCCRIITASHRIAPSRFASPSHLCALHRAGTLGALAKGTSVTLCDPRWVGWRDCEL